MKHFIPNLVLLLLINSLNVFCQNKNLTSGYLLRYNYLSSNDYLYKKNKTSVSEKYVSFLRIKVEDSIERDEINFKYSLDSCTYKNKYSAEKFKLKKDLEKAQVQILYTKSGKELKIQLLNKENNEYLKNTGYSNEEKIFELPENYVELGFEWTTVRKDENSYGDFSKSTTSKIQNLFIGLEQKSNHECYRIDFNGSIVDIVKQGDYTSTEKGITSGSYWIDKQNGIIIAVETETNYTDCLATDPSGPNLKMKPSASTKTILEYIE